MEFNIANKLDIDFFNRKLDTYSKLRSKLNSYPELNSDFYIFMSPDTLMHMPRLDDYEYAGISTRNNCTGRVGSYHGHKVFSDPSMKYGDVEFR